MSEAFEKIKLALMEDVCIAFPDESPNALDLVMFTDASLVSLSGFLCQPTQPLQTTQKGDIDMEFTNKNIRILGYYSYNLSHSEKSMSTFFKELEAVRKTLIHFKDIIATKR